MKERHAIGRSVPWQHPNGACWMQQHCSHIITGRPRKCHGSRQCRRNMECWNGTNDYAWGKSFFSKFWNCLFRFKTSFITAPSILENPKLQLYGLWPYHKYIRPTVALPPFFYIYLGKRGVRECSITFLIERKVVHDCNLGFSGTLRVRLHQKNDNLRNCFSAPVRLDMTGTKPEEWLICHRHIRRYYFTASQSIAKFGSQISSCPSRRLGPLRTGERDTV